ncbi:PEP-CTERM sorting domain-containing protein [Pseudorhodoferax sp. Leaf267]|uniref:PEP-CTERM sorting domain-containing protein n=1 Tax=Pseudorhodoferax sp. Leaf267 TaxID=1736316 RepID=UPI000700DBDB|nr:PEP-CTERM sorting domain-containing protein [Pseudorhodoferax sp. Leaf267]KQP12660.1 hypothetical protein ASF43_20710 [Pseudorhodoferax sp. Leaf267]
MNHPISRTPRLARQAASLGLALGLSLLAAASQAAVARFDTTSFSYTVSGGTLSWSAAETYQALDAEAASGGGTLGSDAQNSYLGAWTTASVAAQTTYSGANVGATADQLVQANASATRTSLAPADLPTHTSRAYGNQAGVYSLSEDGTVTFTVGWSLQVEGASTDPTSDYANAFMSFTAGLYDYSVTTSYEEGLFSFDSLSGLATASGTWTVTVALQAGELGFYDLTGTASAEADAAYAANAVPEPGSLALLAAGLGTLVAVRRRRAPRPAA